MNVVIQELKRQIKTYGSQIAWALDHHVSPAYVSDILSGRREVSDNFANKVGFTVKKVYDKVK